MSPSLLTFPPRTLPVVDMAPLAVTLLVVMLLPVMLPVTVSNPPVIKFAPVTFPVALTIAVLTLPLVILPTAVMVVLT